MSTNSSCRDIKRTEEVKNMLSDLNFITLGAENDANCEGRDPGNPVDVSWESV